MTFLKTAAVSAVVALAGTAASAATFDFAAEGDLDERGVFDGTVVQNANTGGIAITFSATGGFAYFDGSSNGLPGGLGACMELEGGDGTECADPSDDNIRAGEDVTISFENEIFLSGLTFGSRTHGSVNDANTLLINGQALTFGAASSTTFQGTSFTFAYGGDSPEVFYVRGGNVSEIPLPASGLLLLGALGGIAAAKRRK